MFITRKDTEISKDEWKEVIITSHYMKTMSEWMGSSNDRETYHNGAFYVGTIPYGRIMWRKGKLEIDISKSYISIIHENISNIAKQLNADFYFSKNIIFDPSKHLPSVQVKVNREQVYFNDIEFPSTWMCIKASSTDQMLNELGLEKQGECDLIELNPASSIIYVVRELYNLTIILGNSLLHEFGDEHNSLENYSDQIIKRLKLASKKYGEIQLYVDNTSNMLKLIGQFQEGKTKLFDISYEGKTYRKGNRNKVIQDMNPSEVAAIYSLNVEDLIFMKELLTQKIEMYK